MVPPNSRSCSFGQNVTIGLLVILATAVCVTAQTECSATEKANLLCGGEGQTCRKYEVANVATTYQCCTTAGCDYPRCPEEFTCNVLANCDQKYGAPECYCDAGFYGSGEGTGEGAGGSDGCDTSGWQLRTVVNLLGVPCDARIGGAGGPPAFDLATGKLDADFWREHRDTFANLFFDGDAPAYVGRNMIHEVYAAGSADCANGWTGLQLSLGVVFGRENKTEAVAATRVFAANLQGASPVVFFSGVPDFQTQLNSQNDEGLYEIDDEVITFGPKLYTFLSGTTSDEQQIRPVGFEVEAVYFQTACMSSGCWVIDLVFTAGENNFVVFYLPKTGVSPSPDIDGKFVDELTYDFDYESGALAWAPWNAYQPAKTISSTFQPVNFPCSSTNYQAGMRHWGESCCLAQFVDLYRPVKSFVDALETPAEEADCEGSTDIECARLLSDSVCPKDPSGGTYGASLPMIVRPDETPSAAANEYSIPQFNRFGKFAGMAESEIQLNGIIEKSLGIYRARVKLDNVELRRLAGQMVGTVGVQYTIDTFIGMVDVKPTGAEGFLDAMASQTAIHLEKTDFFTVTMVNGANEYTFVYYVNLRLMEVLQEDRDQEETASQQLERTYRTDRQNAAHFIQLTFSIGRQYTPMYPGTPQAEIIPLDSVRVGVGGALSEQTTTDSFFHTCLEYNDPKSSNTEGTWQDQATKGLFDSRFQSLGAAAGTQTCSPELAMCAQTAEIQDEFINFNIPVGIDWFPAEPDTPADVAETFIYVSLVVTAEDTEARAAGKPLPNEGGDPYQMKTTIFAEIPVVEGGRYTYCDAIVAKTDLKDVVNATLIFGTARDESEWTRLRVFEEVASTSLQPQEAERFTSSSIEAGMMTLVLEGAPSYFNTGTGLGSDNYGVQLEDVVTIHIMEREPAFEAAGTASKRVLDLLDAPGSDNFAPATPVAELRTLGYDLNGAFRFKIDREGNTASLEPTRALLNICQFNPPRPSLDDVFPTTCVIRKDVDAKVYMARDNNFQTAMEVAVASTSPPEPTTDNEAFIASFLGTSTYSSNLGNAFSRLIANKFSLNGRYTRAFWINPGYEWTPTQVGNQAIFVVSQKLFVFCLITLDEEFTSGGSSSSRRVHRLLTQKHARSRRAGTTETEGASALAGQMTAGFSSSKKTVLAATYQLPEEHVTTWNSKLTLTRLQACNQDRAAVRKELAAGLLKAFKASAGSVAHVQIAELELDLGEENCFRVSRDGTLGARRAGETDLSVATASAQALVIFKEAKSKINPNLLAKQPLVISATPVGLPANYQLDPNYNPGDVIEEEEESSTDMMPIIIGAAGGVGGCLVLTAIGFFVWKRRGASEDAAEVYMPAAASKSARKSLADEFAGDLPPDLMATALGSTDTDKGGSTKRLSSSQVDDLRAALGSDVV